MHANTEPLISLSAGNLTVLRAPHVGVEQLAGSGRRLAFLGVPFEGGNVCPDRPGASGGPLAFRLASNQYFSWSAEWGIDLEAAYGLADCGDVPIVSGNLERMHDVIEHFVSQILEAGATPVMIGGDHSVSIPGARATARYLKGGSMGYLALDAHLDAGESWNGESQTHASGVPRVAELPNVRPENVAVVGVRGTLGQSQSFVDYMHRVGANYFTMREVADRGITEVMTEALDKVWDGVEGVYVTVDTDAIDAAYAPGTTEPEPAGFTAREMLEVARLIGERGFSAIDSAELCPIYDPGGVTAKLVWTTLAEVLFASAAAGK